MTLQADDTFRGLSWTQKAFTPRAMSWSYDPEKSLFLPSITVREITQGDDGETIAIPVAPPDGGYEVPPIPLPPPVPPIPVPPLDWGFVDRMFIPALAGVDDSNVLYNFDSHHIDPTAEGNLTNGIVLEDDTETFAEGYGIVPAGAISATCTALLRNNNFTGGMVLYNEVEITTIGLTDLVRTDSGWQTLTSANFSGYQSEVLSISFSVSPGQLICCTFGRDGYDASDTEPLFNALYGWIIYFS
jgi:hypothetical protein